MRLNNFKRSDLPQEHLLSDYAVDLIRDCLTVVTFPKGYLLMHVDAIFENAYIIRQGIIRSFAYKEDKEITFGFSREGDIITASLGYLSKEKSYENFQLLEDTTLYQINLQKMKQLYGSNLEICNWSRVITEIEAIKTEKRLLDLLFLTPEERYIKLMRVDKALFNRVPLKEIASYIGISAISLSRIRGRIK